MQNPASPPITGNVSASIADHIAAAGNFERVSPRYLDCPSGLGHPFRGPAFVHRKDRRDTHQGLGSGGLTTTASSRLAWQWHHHESHHPVRIMSALPFWAVGTAGLRATRDELANAMRELGRSLERLEKAL